MLLVGACRPWIGPTFIRPQVESVRRPQDDGDDFEAMTATTWCCCTAISQSLGEQSADFLWHIPPLQLDVDGQ